jgi:hypothetical protein
MWIFLVVLVILAIVATVLTEVEKFGWATLLLIVGVAVAQFFHVVDLFDWVKGHALDTGLYALAYVGSGLLWSFGKWFFFLWRFRDKYREYKLKFLLGLNPAFTGDMPVPTDQLPHFYDFLDRQERYSSAYYRVFKDNPLSKKPRAANNKARIVSWMSLWPCSVIGTLLNDPVRRLFDAIFSWVKGLYQKMSDAMFAKDVELK